MNSSKTVSNLLLLFSFCVFQIKCAVVVWNNETHVENEPRNCTQKMKSLSNIEARKKEEDLMSKILPMMVMPFMVQTTLLPMMLISMKFMLMKSMFLGKMAIILGLVTFLRYLLKNQGGLYSHNVEVQQSHHHDLSHQNYGYNRRNEPVVNEPHVNKTKKRKKREVYHAKSVITK